MLGVLLGFLCALLLHAGFLAFGGLLIPKAEESHARLQEVELVSVEEDAPEKPKEDEEPAEATERIEAEVEEAPDAGEIIRSLELAAAATPKLEAASLSAIEDALRGSSGGSMGFGDAMSFTSGGQIGGTGTPGGISEKMEDAFSLADIDQKPRAVFQVAPMFPSEMRGKKVQGQVTLIFVVDAAGKVTELRVEKSSHPAFERPALDAVKQWKFEPAVKGGQQVACKMRLPMRFQEAGA